MKFISQRRRAERRRQLRLAGVSLAGLVLATGLGGFLLPAERITTGTATIPRSPESVWRVLTDLDGMPLWRSDVVALERLPDQEGKTAWREVGRRESRVVEFAVTEPPRRLVMQWDGPGRPGTLVRSLELQGTREGTRVTVTDRRIVANPLLRLLGRLAPGGSPAGRFLRDLDLRLSLSRRQVAAGSD